MRLIDAEAWKLELLLLHGTDERTSWIINRINHAPTVDAVPVVRCKDCTHWVQNPHGVMGLCFKHKDIAIAVGENDFCSYGEKSLKP